MCHLEQEQQLFITVSEDVEINEQMQLLVEASEVVEVECKLAQ